MYAFPTAFFNSSMFGGASVWFGDTSADDRVPGDTLVSSLIAAEARAGDCIVAIAATFPKAYSKE